MTFNAKDASDNTVQLKTTADNGEEVPHNIIDNLPGKATIGASAPSGGVQITAKDPSDNSVALECTSGDNHLKTEPQGGTIDTITNPVNVVLASGSDIVGSVNVRGYQSESSITVETGKLANPTTSTTLMASAPAGFIHVAQLELVVDVDDVEVEVYSGTTRIKYGYLKAGVPWIVHNSLARTKTVTSGDEIKVKITPSTGTPNLYYNLEHHTAD